MNSRSFRHVSCLLAVLALLCHLAGPQIHAANRVTYNVYDWQVLRTPHFDIYFDKGKDKLAEYAARIAEASHASISKQIGFELTHIVPIFIYNGHNDFKNTTISYEVLPSGVEGFTEVFKNRVVVPFPGSYEEFRHVLHHELIHAFQYNVFYGDFWESLFMRPFLFSAPLWFMEGLAEHLSLGEDRTTDMIMRDAVLNRMMPSLLELDDLGSLSPYKYYFVYKGGQEFLNYVAMTYGPEKPGELLKHFRFSKDMNASLVAVLGKGLETLSKDWTLFLEKKYFPDVTYKEVWDKKFRFITRHFEDGSFRNTKPVFTKDGKQLLFFTDGRLVSEIISVELIDTEYRKTIVRGTTSVKFEELQTEANKLGVSLDNRNLLFVSTSGAQDRLNILNLKRKRLVRVLSPGMDRILSAAFSPDGTQVVFSGVKNGKADLYVMDIVTKKMNQLLGDEFYDAQPFWAKDDRIYFVSNREKGIWSDHYDIFSVSPDGSGLRKVVSSPHADVMPEVSPDGKSLAFVSYRNGSPNIFIKDLEKGTERQITDVIGGAFDPSWSPDGDKLVFAFYNRLGQDICVLELTNTPPVAAPMRTAFATDTNSKKDLPPSLHEPEKDRVGKAGFTFTPDFVNAYVGYSDYSQFLGTVYFEGSDMLGSHRIQLDGNFYTRQSDLNFDLFYLYQKYRLNMGVGAFNRKDYYLEWVGTGYTNYNVYFKRRTGAFVQASYPFSRFSSFIARNSYMDYEESYTKGTSASVKSDSYILSCGYEFNNLLFNGNYFIKGSYLGLWFDAAPPIAKGFWEFQRFSLDARQFFPFSRTTALAARVNFASIMGPDAYHQPFYIGGMDSIRGYNYDIFRGENLALVKFELRFPFIDAIKFSFPIPLLLRNLTGAVYWDFGAVWDNPEKTVFAYYRGNELQFDAIKSGVGMGIRMHLFNYLKIIFDYASPFDGNSILPLERWRGYLSIGYDF